ncbi:MAG: CDP-alcohol phosphatidyltransferase family protein [Thaumarchaeota archaeon]|nr:CDP-alcohol phosphatidyltransferase family protein [Nitrososphaerota archaeon]
MLDRFRERLKGYFYTIGTAFAQVGLSPTFWTFVGVALALGAAAAYFSSGTVGQFMGGLLLLSSGFFDVVDGAVAKATGKVSRSGAFLDSTLDRVAEVAVFIGILGGKYSDPTLVLSAASFSLLVSYTRARAESLGTSLAGVGIGERAERLLVVGLSSLVGRVDAGVAIVVVLAGFTFVERAYRGARAMRRSA